MIWFTALSMLIIGALASLPLWGGAGIMRLTVEFLTLLALAQLWNLLAGYTGLVSIGQQAWIGIGGYALIVAVNDLGLPILLGLALAGFIAMLLALPAAGLLFRLRGGYFSVSTWVMAEVLRLLVTNSTDWMRGGLGRTLDTGTLSRETRELLTYALAVVIGLGIVALVHLLMRTRSGLALIAIRDSEMAAASLGIETQRMKLYLYLLCASGTGIVGALIYLNLLRITPDAAFSVQWTAFMIFIVVIGGIGTIEGPIVGTIIFFILRQFLSDFGEWSLILLGAVAVIMMMFAPEGVWGIIRRRWQFEIFPVQRRIGTDADDMHLPSH
ncbi:MAG: branched-chain amino acid ABC transporter permease [Roseiflexus sp.]|nr:branched-chain amino acid ABC transporter permease [Roseiflexus sp.]